MITTKDKHRAIVEAMLDADETLQALVNMSLGSPGTGTSGGQTAMTKTINVGRYIDEHGIVERGVNGVYDLFNIWVALTGRRMVIFRGSWFSFTPKPKKLLTSVDRGDVELSWRDEKVVGGHVRLYHFRFPDDHHLVRLGTPHDEADRFVAALGTQAVQLPPRE